jgi:glucosyl-3-phosphoglycerate synthase
MPAGTRQNRHQSLRALGEMAYAVLAAVEHRIAPAQRTGKIDADGRYLRPWQGGAVTRVPVLERPPIRSALRYNLHVTIDTSSVGQ